MHSGEQYGLSPGTVVIDPQRLQNEMYAVTHPLEIINRPAARAINQVASANVATESPHVPSSWSFEIIDEVNGPSAMERCFCCKSALWKSTTVQIANGNITCPPMGSQALYGLFHIVEEKGSHTRITLRTQFQPFAVLRTGNTDQVKPFIQCIEAAGAVGFGDPPGPRKPAGSPQAAHAPPVRPPRDHGRRGGGLREWAVCRFRPALSTLMHNGEGTLKTLNGIERLVAWKSRFVTEQRENDRAHCGSCSLPTGCFLYTCTSGRLPFRSDPGLL